MCLVGVASVAGSDVGFRVGIFPELFIENNLLLKVLGTSSFFRKIIFQLLFYLYLNSLF